MENEKREWDTTQSVFIGISFVLLLAGIFSYKVTLIGIGVGILALNFKK